MDIFTRVNRLQEEKKRQFMQSLSKVGDPKEILSHIQNMPILCPEGRGFLNIYPEIRFDERFLVRCLGKRIQIIPTQVIRFSFLTFCVDSRSKYCRFFLAQNAGQRYYISDAVESQYAQPLLQAFRRYTPTFESGPDFVDEKLVRQYDMDAQGLVFSQDGALFRSAKKEKLRYADMLSFAIQYENCADGGDTTDQNYFLVIYMRDGSQRTFHSIYVAEDCFRLAKTIQHFAPHLRYQLA